MFHASARGYPSAREVWLAGIAGSVSVRKTRLHHYSAAHPHLLRPAVSAMREPRATSRYQPTRRPTQRTRLSVSGTATARVSADAGPGSRRLTMRLRPIQLLAHLGRCGPGGPKIITGWTGFAARERS
jgi:hypothetical protein